MKRTLVLFGIIGFCLLSPLATEAQSIKHKITPRVIDREVAPRDIFTETITIENLATYKNTVYPTVNTVLVDEGGDITDFSPPSMSDNKVTVTSWLAIQRAGIELKPGETVTVPLNIKIHPQAEAGLYHAFIGFGTGRNRDIAERQVKDGIAPGVIVTLSIGQDKAEFLKLDNFLIDRFVTSADNSAVTYALKNPGEAEVTPRGEIILSDSKGVEVAAITINPDGNVLAPAEERVYKATVPTEGLLGKYKAFLTVDYGTKQLASVYDTAFFYILPWQKLLTILGILLFVAILLTIILHRQYRDDEDDDEHGAEYIPLFVRDRQSEEQEHDINLKQG